MLEVQHVIGLEQYVELHDSLPLTRDEEDEDNPDLLSYVQTISTKASNSVCSTLHPQSYIVHSYELRKPIDHVYHLSMSPRPKISNSTESFACRIHNLHDEIIK